MKSSIPEHEKLFEEICGKLSELSTRSDSPNPEEWTDKIEKMQTQIKKSQEDLQSAQEDLQDKLRALDHLNTSKSDHSEELQKLSDQLDLERQNSSKLSTDLAKSLELNLKLQFEIEEIRSKSNQTLLEERKHNSYLIEKNRSLATDFELSQALCTEVKQELQKAKESYHAQSAAWNREQQDLSQRNHDFDTLCQDQNAKLHELAQLTAQKEQELAKLSETLFSFEAHSNQQSEALKNLSMVAERKLIELKLTLDKKAAEAQDYYSHLQQALTQVAVLKQENAALKDYVAKLTTLHNQTQNQVAQMSKQQGAENATLFKPTLSAGTDL